MQVSMTERFASTQRVTLHHGERGLRLSAEPAVSARRRRIDLLLGVVSLVLFSLLLWSSGPGFMWGYVLGMDACILFLWALMAGGARIDRNYIVFAPDAYYSDGWRHQPKDRVEATPRWIKVPRTIPFGLNWIELKCGRLYVRPASFVDFRTRLLIVRELQALYPEMDVRLGRPPSAEESAWVQEHRDALRAGATVCVVGCEATVTFADDAGGDWESRGELS